MENRLIFLYFFLVSTEGRSRQKLTKIWFLVEAFKVLRGRKKTILELRCDTILFPELLFEFILKAVDIKI
jgi:hypothetical protein